MQEAVKAKKAEKKQILDEFIAATGYHRKVATQILKHGRPRCSGKKHGLPKIYQGDVLVALEQIWEVCGRICDHPDSERTFSLMKAEPRYECGGGDGEAHRTRKGIARKRKKGRERGRSHSRFPTDRQFSIYFPFIPREAHPWGLTLRLVGRPRMFGDRSPLKDYHS